MSRFEKIRWFTLTALRAFLSLLDLVGVLAIGFVATSTALFLTDGSDPSRVLEFAGLTIPAVNAQSLPWVSGSVLLLFLIKAFFSVVLTKRAAFFVAKIEARAAKTIAEIGFGGDLLDVRKRSREEITYAIQVGSPAAFNTLLNAVNTLITETMLFVVICIGFLFIDPMATLAAVIYFCMIAFVIQFFVGSLMSKAGMINARSSVAANTAISDLLSVFRELLVLGKRRTYIEDIYSARVLAANSSATAYYLNGMPRYVIEAGLLVGVAIFVLSQALSGDIARSAGAIGVFLSGGFRLTAALLPLQSSLLTMKSAIPIAKVAHDILPTSQGLIEMPKVHTPNKEHKVGSDRPIGVRFIDVSFSYPGSDKAAVKKVNFDVSPGSQVALMGTSGGGKSTIADLLCQVLVPSSGKIMLHQSPGFTSGDLRNYVSYVPQKPGLVSGTIAENIALAELPKDIDRNRVIEVMELANLGDLHVELPKGIDTPLGNLQDSLSGGQLQRLGLARALYSGPSLLVMDEATSALDAESEAQIQKSLDAMRGKVTVVLIAHRLNTIQYADNVLLIESGEVEDSGQFKDLALRNPSVQRAINLMNVDHD